MRFTHLLRLLLQTSILVVVAWLGHEISSLAHLPVPGSIIGLLLLFILLQCRVVKIEWVEQGAALLISNMLLFFIPSSLGLIQYGRLIRESGVQLLLVIAISTAVVMGMTGWFAEFLNRRRKEAKSRAALD
ncbi:holin-like protein CidA [Alicyclobacillus contaminans]|uniref:CidA/LrgA family protein n=1 Tax=Alicyclobacillus contaminans TaxID=392016 RepID=UPI000420D87D|nr:CidA/LrgA family protein [Alicyclobacillus contaminans]GMA50791.1 holin-like protein CidA [Alicyclobacillus contaminans]